MGIFLFVLFWIQYNNFILIRRNNRDRVFCFSISIISLFIYIIIYHYFEGIFFGLIFISFIYISYTDIRYYLIYDNINVSVFLLNISYVIMNDLYLNFIIESSILIVLYIIILTVMRIKKTEYIGGGDLKLIFAMNGIIGLNNLPKVLFIASVISLIFYIILLSKSNKNKQICFGPFLCIGYFIIILFKHLLI